MPWELQTKEDGVWLVLAGGGSINLGQEEEVSAALAHWLGERVYRENKIRLVEINNRYSPTKNDS